MEEEQQLQTPEQTHQLIMEILSADMRHTQNDFYNGLKSQLSIKLGLDTDISNCRMVLTSHSQPHKITIQLSKKLRPDNKYVEENRILISDLTANAPICYEFFHTIFYINDFPRARSTELFKHTPNAEDPYKIETTNAREFEFASVATTLFEVLKEKTSEILIIE
jgi:hypothetical protein